MTVQVIAARTPKISLKVRLSLRLRKPAIRDQGGRGTMRIGKMPPLIMTMMTLHQELPKKRSQKHQKKKKRSKAKAEREASPADLPIDPNEPTYCLCNQVSYGEMIGCDNEECPIEWFHFSCVGLNHKPKGKWYCPECRGENEKTMGKALEKSKKERAYNR